MTEFGTVLKGNFLTGIFHLFNHVCVLEQNFIFVGRISKAASHTLLTYFTTLYYTILYYTTLYYTILYYTILYYTILYYSWRKRSCHACWKLMLESNIKQFYHPRSEDSAVNAYDKSRRFLWISCCWFCIYF